jgi:hypothetical protein
VLLLLRLPVVLLLFPIVPVLPPRVLPLLELLPREFMLFILPIVPLVLPPVVPELLPMLLPFVVPPMLSLPIVEVVLVVPVVPVVPVVVLPVVIVLLVLFVVPVLFVLSPPPHAVQSIAKAATARRAKIRRIWFSSYCPSFVKEQPRPSATKLP